jgi:hypothetical protein
MQVSATLGWSGGPVGTVISSHPLPRAREQRQDCLTVRRCLPTIPHRALRLDRRLTTDQDVVGCMPSEAAAQPPTLREGMVSGDFATARASSDLAPLRWIKSSSAATTVAASRSPDSSSLLSQQACVQTDLADACRMLGSLSTPWRAPGTWFNQPAYKPEETSCGRLGGGVSFAPSTAPLQ